MASDIVIGDRHGESSANWLSAEAMHVARQCGFRVALNDPYAGGAIVARHGKPGVGVHALQIEIDRSSYLLADGRSPSRGFDRVADLLETLATTLGEAILDRRLDEAAE
jgi:N-formylglutamate amidohydrolase